MSEMTTGTKASSGKRFESAIGVLLRVGVALAAAVVLAGGIIYLAKFGGTHPDYKIFLGEPAEFSRVSAILHNAVGGSGPDLIQLGLLLLIATPIARVVVSVLVFLAEKDWLYVAFTMIVLAVLVYGLAGS
jgi:uncharacterized membrane protein